MLVERGTITSRPVSSSVDGSSLPLMNVYSPRKASPSYYMWTMLVSSLPISLTLFARLHPLRKITISLMKVLSMISLALDSIAIMMAPFKLSVW